MPPGVIGHHIATLWIHPRIAGTEKLKGFYFCDLTVCTQASAPACAAECGNVSQTLGRGCGVGRGLGIGVPLGVGVGRGVAVGVAVVVAVGVGVGVPPSVTVRVTGTATKGRTGSLRPMQTLAWCVPTVRSLASMCTVTCLQGLFRGRLTLGSQYEAPVRRRKASALVSASAIGRTLFSELKPLPLHEISCLVASISRVRNRRFGGKSGQ